MLRGGCDGEAACLGDGWDVDVEPLAGEVGKYWLCKLVRSDVVLTPLVVPAFKVFVPSSKGVGEE